MFIKIKIFSNLHSIMSDIFTRNKRIKRKRAEFSARFIFTSYNIHDKIIVTIDKVIIL